MIDIENLSPEQRDELLAKLQADKKQAAENKRNAYEGIRKDVVSRIRERVVKQAEEVQNLFDFVTGETTAFYQIMNEYGQISREGQMNYKIVDDNFRIEVKTNKVKKFDERAEVAEARLITFLQEWMESSDKGSDDVMYQLAMSFLSRNQQGDLDYKSISKLYAMENKFNSPVYSDIMQLFKESHCVEGTATNFYFFQKDKLGVWRKIEISFNRL
ncbi:DUF3164 family protein [Bacteroidales bacterium OttesenSCG-928-J19]|nr:DUF3164 family protein [Bacteroidales bacterium OttesenSCG-928-J19]